MKHLALHPAPVRKGLAAALILGVGLVTLVLDLWTKAWAEERLSQGHIVVIDGLFDFRLVYNSGVAFGMMRNLPETIRVPVLVFLSGGVLLFVVFYCLPLYFRSPWASLCAGMLVGGAIGNLYERFFNGRVVDFFYNYYGSFRWPAYNIADIGIVVGLIGMMAIMLKMDSDVAKIVEASPASQAKAGSKPVTGEANAPRGFTLLEVMIALAILSISLVALIEAQGQALHATNAIKSFSIVPFLARSKMVDIEEDLCKNGFGDTDKRLEGDFEVDGYKEISWEARIRKTSIKPDLNMLGGGGGGANGQGQTGSGPTAAFGGLLGSYLENFVTQLNQRIRHCQLTIVWEERGQLRSFDVVTHFIDLPGICPNQNLDTNALAAQQAAAADQASAQAQQNTANQINGNNTTNNSTTTTK
jgi:lipoprotein signal peptidase